MNGIQFVYLYLFSDKCCFGYGNQVGAGEENSNLKKVTFFFLCNMLIFNTQDWSERARVDDTAKPKPHKKK